MQLVARQRDESLRATYAGEIQNCLYFLMKLAVIGGMLRRQGYSWRERPAISHKLLVRGEHLSSIACISMQVVLECATVSDSVNGDTFLCLCPLQATHAI